MAKIVDEYIARATLVKLQAVKHCCVSNTTTTTTFWIVNSNRFFFHSIQFELEMYGIQQFNCLFLAQHLRKTPIQSANYFKCYFFSSLVSSFFPLSLQCHLNFSIMLSQFTTCHFVFHLILFENRFPIEWQNKEGLLADGIHNC